MNSTNQLEVRSLSGVPFGQIHQSVNRAFADYAVDIQMTAEELDSL